MTVRAMSIYGTRPEAIKLAPVVNALRAEPGIQSRTVVTGQHREMLDQVNRVFGIVPDHDLDVFGKGQSLNRLMAKVLEGLDGVLAEVKPDVDKLLRSTFDALSGIAFADDKPFYDAFPAGREAENAWSTRSLKDGVTAAFGVGYDWIGLRLEGEFLLWLQRQK